MDGLSFDYLPNTSIYLYQRKDMFRLNTDTALLGQFMKVRKNETLLDIGTNNGALLLYASLTCKSKMIGIDVQVEACELAKKNCDYNQLENVEIFHQDIKDFKCEAVDVIVCNPPYFKVTHEKQLNLNEYRRIARHEHYLTLDVLIQKVSECLKDKGRFYLVHRSDRMVELIAKLNEYHLVVKTIQLIRDEENELAHGILIEAIKGGLQGCDVLKEHIVTR